MCENKINKKMIFYFNLYLILKMISVVYFPKPKQIENASECLELIKIYETQEGKKFDGCRHNQVFVDIAIKYSGENSRSNLYVSTH